jgi:hypothetical protein
MSVFEMAMSGVCVLAVGSAWWWAVTRPAFSEWMTALAQRHSKETEKAVMLAWADGHEAGQEYERLRGSKPRA